MKLFAKLVFVLSVSLFATTSQAKTENLGDVTGLSVFGISNDGFGQFEDILTFTLTDGGAFDGSLFSMSFTNSGYLIEDFYVELTNGTDTFGSYVTDHFVFESFALDAGDYTATLSGNFGGAGTYDMTIAAVPEPSVYALMLSGLGLVGFMAARRKKV